MNKKPFQVVLSDQDSFRIAAIQVKGFWPVNMIYVQQDFEPWQKDSIPRINWGSGGFSNTIPNLESTENFIAALKEAVRISKKWAKAPLKGQITQLKKG